MLSIETILYLDLGETNGMVMEHSDTMSQSKFVREKYYLKPHLCRRPEYPSSNLPEIQDEIASLGLQMLVTGCGRSLYWIFLIEQLSFALNLEHRCVRKGASPNGIREAPINCILDL